MSAVHELKGESLDIIIHNPGGSAEATEQIVLYLRKMFSHIRAIIPQNAMSAALCWLALVMKLLWQHTLRLVL